MAWAKWARNRKDPTLVRWYVAWREGKKVRTKPTGVTSRVPEGARPSRVPQKVERLVAKAGRLRAEAPFGVVVLEEITFERFALEKWLPLRTNRAVKRDREIITKYLIPWFGRELLYSVRPHEVEAKITVLASAINGKGRRRIGTAIKVRGLLRKMLNDAIRWGYLRPGQNPAVGFRMEADRLPPEEMSVEEICRLLEVLRQDHPRWRAMVLTATLAGGLRYGEAAGLDGQHVLFDRPHEWGMGKICIEQQAPANGGGVVEILKTSTSRRVVDMPWPVHQALLDLPLLDGAPVFPGEKGGRLNYRWFIYRVWKPALRRAGLPEDHGFHRLRHTFVSLTVAWGQMGENPVYVAGQTGHASTKLLLDEYAHMMREGRRLDREATLARIWRAAFPDRPIPRPTSVTAEKRGVSTKGAGGQR